MINPLFGRWDTGEWSSCSATCGVGLMTRTVACTHQPSRSSNHSQILRDEDCQSPKPSPVQACNRFDCAPSWELHDWGKVRWPPEEWVTQTNMANSNHETLIMWPQCSRSCGGGFQRRQILCKQRMADGSYLELPDTFCPSRSPASQQTCARMDCPPHWVATDWSQVGYSESLHPKVAEIRIKFV